MSVRTDDQVANLDRQRIERPYRDTLREISELADSLTSAHGPLAVSVDARNGVEEIKQLCAARLREGAA